MRRIFVYALTGLLLLAACSSQDKLNGDWQLQAYGPTTNPIPAQAKAALTFADGELSGNTGCNSLSGQYRIVGNELLFYELSTTLIACLDANIMQQENHLLTGLNSVSRFTVQGNQLVLYDADGQQVLVFQRVPQHK